MNHWAGGSRVEDVAEMGTSHPNPWVLSVSTLQKKVGTSTTGLSVLNFLSLECVWDPRSGSTFAYESPDSARLHCRPRNQTP